MNSYEIVNYVSNGAVAFGLFSAYDVLVDGREFSGYATKDGLTFAISTVISEWSADMLSNLWNENSFSKMITKPLLNGIIYMYLYDYMIRPEYEGAKDNNSNFLMASLSEVLLSYVSNPIIAIFTGMKMNY